MPHNDQVRPHGVERHRGIDERLALFNRRRGDRHVHHVRAQPFASKLEGRLRASGGLKEKVDLRPPPQRRFFLFNLAGHFDRVVRHIEKRADVAR
jgi:hypothetical protein